MHRFLPALPRGSLLRGPLLWGPLLWGPLLWGLAALTLLLPAPATAQNLDYDVWDEDFQVVTPQKEGDPLAGRDLADAFQERNKPLTDAKIKQMRAITALLLQHDVGYGTWNYMPWVLNIGERVVQGQPTCHGSVDTYGPSVTMAPGLDFPSSDSAVYIFGFVKGYVDINGAGGMTLPSVTGNVFTAILYPDQPGCLAATTIGLWDPEMRANNLQPGNVLVDGTNTFFVTGEDLNAMPAYAREEFLEAFKAMGRVEH